MKFNFRKISAIAISALMTGMTMGTAAAAVYPAPFVSGGTADVAIVYGTGAGVSSLDLVQAGNIQESLGTFVDGGTVAVEGGETFKLDKDSNHFNFNNALNGVYTTLGDKEMDFLADGTYDDGDIDTDYSQKITLSNKDLTLFTSSEYNDKEPTIGFHWSDGDFILNYTVEFDDDISFADLVDTDLPLFGNTYYVMNVKANQIDLLDSAEKVVITEGDSKVIGDKTVSVEGFVTDGKVKLNVDGEVTDKLSEHSTYKLQDGSYVIVNEINYNSKESGISNVEISIGKGKISLKKGDDIELNEEDVNNLQANWENNTGTFDSLTITWNSDDDSFLTQESALTMPLFENIKLVFGGMNFPEESEKISLTTGEEMTLEMGNYNLPLFFVDQSGDAGIGYLGEEDYHLVTAASTLTSNYTGGAGRTAGNTTALTGGLDLVKKNRFLVTGLDTDLTDIDTLYYELSSIDYTDSTHWTVELDDLIGTKDITLSDKLTDTEDVGDITVSIVDVNSTHAYLKFTPASTTLSFNTAVSEKGMKIALPAKTSTETLNFASAGQTLTFTEATKDDDIGQGMPFTVTVKNNSDEDLHVTGYNTSIVDAKVSTDVYTGYVLSDLATKVSFDKSGDAYNFDLEYYGEEVTADVSVIGGTSTVSSGSNVLGNILVKDTEVSTVATKNLIVVGGSCINSAAATLVGGAKCGAAWTEATGIGAGQFLIKGYADNDLTSKMALLVAGYEAADTVKAATYLTNEDNVDTSKEYKGTTSTNVAVVVE